MFDMGEYLQSKDNYVLVTAVGTNSVRLNHSRSSITLCIYTKRLFMSMVTDLFT